MTDDFHATCPFCGLLCDDLTVRTQSGAIAVTGAGCALSVAAFGHQADAAAVQPRVGGRTATLDEAAAKAADVLRAARQPLICGLATDVAGMRAVMSLADRCGAVLDHMNSVAKFRNLLVLQDSGWITTTLGEVKNRADLIILAGTDVVSRFPRFFERFVWNRETLFELDPQQREIVYLGQGLDTRAGISPTGRAPNLVPCEVARLGEAFGFMRALLAGRRLQARGAAGVPGADWQALVERIRAARYTVIVWAAPDLDFPHAELTVRNLCELIKDLNRSARVAGLPLGGSNGDFTADAVELWQTGFPFRTGFGTGAPAYDPYQWSAVRLLSSGEADAMLWIGSFDADLPPPRAGVPSIVLGRGGMALKREPDVFIPVGTPGLDHAGHLLRADKVVALPLPKLRDIGLPGVAQVVAAIDGHLASVSLC
jgi:formylmethanofuran dehydrogenase subunit B